MSRSAAELGHYLPFASVGLPAARHCAIQEARRGGLKRRGQVGERKYVGALCWLRKLQIANARVRPRPVQRPAMDPGGRAAAVELALRPQSRPRVQVRMLTRRPKAAVPPDWPPRVAACFQSAPQARARPCIRPRAATLQQPLQQPSGSGALPSNSADRHLTDRVQ